MTRRRLPGTAGDSAGSPRPELAPQTAEQVRALLAETQAVSARLAALHEVAAAMQSSLDSATVLRTLAREARWVLDFQWCTVAELSEGGYREQVLMPAGKEAPASGKVGLDAGPVGAAIRAGHALLLPGLAGEPLVPEGMESALILPLRSRGAVIGSLNFYAAAPDHYRVDDLRVAGTLAAQAAVVIQNTRLFEAVSAARDELHTVLESISDGVIVFGADMAVLLVNRAGRELLGLPGRPLAGRSLASLALLARANGRRLLRSRSLAALRDEIGAQAQGVLQLSDGRHLEWRLTPIQGSLSLAGQMLTIRDITARVQLDAMRDDLIAMLVHDLRTPLTTMLLSLDLMGAQNLDEETQVELRDRAQHGARQMLRQVNTLLDLRKLEAGRLDLAYELRSVGDLIERTVDTYWELARLSEIELGVVVPPDLPVAPLDADLITRVLENLVGNGLKFTPSGGSVTLRASADGRFVTVEVLDTGIGVPPELGEQVFEKYIQANSGQQRRGAGLGLAFCKLVIQAHQGQIGVRPNPAGGSIFWLRLPLGGAERAAEPVG